MLVRLLLLGLMFFSLSFCVKHEMVAKFEPKQDFSGRLLVMDQKHRFQLDMDWAGDAKQGNVRLTHGLSGRIVDVRWMNETMRWRDNQQSLSWQMLTVDELLDMGVIFPPWVMAKIFAGDLPATMMSKDQRTWQGKLAEHELKIIWASAQQKVELVDLKRGKKAGVMFDE